MSSVTGKMKRMSLRYALVGLLAEEPMSGYDLTKRFAVSLANAWPAQHSQIYPELARLLDLGWIRQTGQGPRGRKVYEATPEGVSALREWLTRTEPDRTLRHEPILRAFFRWTLDPEEASQQFRTDSRAYAAKLAELEDLAGSLDWESSPADRCGRLALEAGLRLYRLLSEWAEWAAERVEAGALDGSGPPA
jgi:PadR family transcriptional regulator, regulatory protein AphA